MRQSPRFIALLIAPLLLSACERPLTPHEAPASGAAALAQGPDDAVKRAILAGPAQPKTVSAVRRRLLGLGGRLEPHLVANRGHENPEGGSFSIFETYTGPMAGGAVREGELFIGYFTERQGDSLAVQQSFAPGLMIELIAWDHAKQLYNFWELLGTGQDAAWHYRGDSADVLADVARIQTGEGGRFGTRLRCSGCHTLGAPIMKELEGPHNDWWTDQRKLALGSLSLVPGAGPEDPRHLAASLFAEARDASQLASAVRGGIDRLVASPAWRSKLSLKQRLRSLFATMEMNLVSDAVPFHERQGSSIELPAAFFVDPRLAGGSPGIRVDAGRYAEALKQAGSVFAPGEAARPETRHAFVVPARSYLDNRVLDGLIADGLLDHELVADVLAVDGTTPVYSAARAGLLRHVPEQASSAGELRARLVASLERAGEEPAAKELLANLVEPHRTAAWHRERASALLRTCQQAANSPAAIAGWLRLASQRRKEIAAAETSRNPRGTILEPGFRVIFPVDKLDTRPGGLRLDPETGRVTGAS